MKEAMKEIYQVLLTEPHTPTVCTKLERIAREALTQPEQPKVRTGDCLLVGVCASEGHKIAPQRTWVGLTEEEIDYYIVHRLGNATKSNLAALIRLCEAKLKEKNT